MLRGFDRGARADVSRAVLPSLEVVLPYPEPSSTAVSDRMRRNRRRDSKPELAVRQLLHAAGLRYRVDRPIRAGSRLVRPDVVFGPARIAVFIDGCFWHRCPEHGTSPRANSAYWGPKLQRNVDRDRAVDDALSTAGWTVIRAWEHEDPQKVAARIASQVSASRGLSSDASNIADGAESLELGSQRRSHNARETGRNRVAELKLLVTTSTDDAKLVGERHEPPELTDAQPPIVPVERSNPGARLTLNRR